MACIVCYWSYGIQKCHFFNLTFKEREAASSNKYSFLGCYYTRVISLPVIPDCAVTKMVCMAFNDISKYA